PGRTLSLHLSRSVRHSSMRIGSKFRESAAIWRADSSKKTRRTSCPPTTKSSRGTKSSVPNAGRQGARPKGGTSFLWIAERPRATEVPTPPNAPTNQIPVFLLLIRAFESFLGRFIDHSCGENCRNIKRRKVF